MPDTPTPGPLDGIRVIDLATPLAEATGRVLADLGAEVIKVEPPGGAASRRLPPFIDGKEGDPDGSLFWAAMALGKRSVVLDLDDAEDRARLVDLARGSDILVESSTPGRMEALGLGPEALRGVNPSLLYVSVTPYGRTGPEARSPATDLTLEAAGGLLGLQGDRDRPPIPVGYPEASLHGAVQAAADAILALHERRRSGLGQHLDTSVQEAVIWTLLFATGFASLHGEDVPGTGAERGGPAPEIIPGFVLPNLAPCKDGHVVMTLVLGEVGARSFADMMRWVAEEGGLDEDLARIPWSSWVLDVMSGKLRPEDVRRGFDRFLAFLATRTKAELQERSVERRWLLAPAWTTADLRADRQLEDRGYWREVGGVSHPGPFAILSETPIRYRRPAPSLGEGQALLGEARAPNVPATPARTGRTTLFEDLKVADFSWVGAGPLIGKDLANLGATVVRVESERRVDASRFIPPWKDRVPGVNTGHSTANFNQSKLGLALDLASDQGREVAHRLVDWADVVIESFTPGTAARLGLDYETLRRRNPDLIMLSSSMRGQTGRERRYTGFGAQGSALAGLVAITGWPDRAPVGPFGAYTDFISPRYSLAALGAALYHRDRTGQGQYVDLSQIEAAIHFIEPLVLDYTVNGRVAGPAGHDSDRACPHGVYRTAGVERYLAIAVETPRQWRALGEICRPLRALDDPALDALPARLEARPRIDALLADWCRDREPFPLARRLREAGVPASVVQRPVDFYQDPQLVHREFFVTLDHPQIGPARYDGLPTRFSDTPARFRRAGPSIGQDTWTVLRELLHMEEGAIADLAAAGVLT